MPTVVEPTATSALAWTGASIALLALGPAAIAGGLASLLVGTLDNSTKERRGRAARIGAIDCFQLSNTLWALVTRTSVWIEYEEVPFERWRFAEVDVDASRPHQVLRDGRAVLRVSRLTDYRTRLLDMFRPQEVREVTESYVLTGNDALGKARYAKLKFDEYVFTPRSGDSIRVTHAD